MRKLRSVFWDVDGTLADTEINGHREAFNLAFDDFNLNWTWDKQLYSHLLRIPGGGERIKAYAKELGEEINEGLLSELRKRKQHHYIQRIRSGHIPLKPGVKRLLKELQLNGIEQWVVTTSSRDSLNALLEVAFTSNGHPFQGSVTADDVYYGKPNPECYLLALSSSGINKTEALAIEDSTMGFIAARSAEIPCLLTPSDWDEELKSHYTKAHAVFDHLGEESLPCNLIFGPPCHQEQVTLDYLQHLILEAPE